MAEKDRCLHDGSQAFGTSINVVKQGKMVFTIVLDEVAVRIVLVDQKESQVSQVTMSNLAAFLVVIFCAV